MGYTCPNCEADCYANGPTPGNTTNWDCPECWWSAIINIPLAPEHQGKDLSRGEAEKLAWGDD